MIYKLENNIIKVYDKSQFNPKHILECGQVFRYGIDTNGNYFVISNKYKATIIEKDDCYEIISNNAPYFVNYFDLDTDYNEIKKTLSCNKILAKMIPYGYGIRILKGDAHEMLFSYIISQNNNIKRIQKIVERLCEIGDVIDDYHAFPTLNQLNLQPLSFYESLGAGYRDKFLMQTAKYLTSIDLENIKSLPTDEIYDFLIKLKGIGPKVASCILLFGFHKKDKFPVDTWLEQVYYRYFSSEKRTRPAMQQFFESEFKEYSGIAQQYLFYYEREIKIHQ